MNKDYVTRNEFNAQMTSAYKIKTLYDMSSTDENLNWRENGGIVNDVVDWVTISGKDFTKYKKLRILAGAMSWSKMYYVLYEVDLTMPFEESGFRGYCGGTVGWTWFENNRLWTERSVCRVSEDKTTISFRSEYFNAGMETGTRTFIAKIEGVM
jgi:hypothetical protein